MEGVSSEMLSLRAQIEKIWGEIGGLPGVGEVEWADLQGDPADNTELVSYIDNQVHQLIQQA